MKRRTWLASFFGAASAMALDPEKALWVPGKKLISIPKPQLRPEIFHHVGTIAINAGWSPAGWVCIKSGSPGVWARIEHHPAVREVMRQRSQRIENHGEQHPSV